MDQGVLRRSASYRHSSSHKVMWNSEVIMDNGFNDFTQLASIFGIVF
jgi:hypothetical protein